MKAGGSMTLALVGFKNAGKSRLGRQASEIARCPFIDTDRLIEKIYFDTTGKLLSCREIFHSSGENVFRMLESKAVESIDLSEEKIIALGGGALTSPGVTDYLKNKGVYFVYLRLTKREAEQRMFKNGVPLFLDPKDPHASFRYVWTHREPLFAKAADVVLDLHKYDEEALVHLLSNLFQYKATHGE